MNLRYPSGLPIICPHCPEQFGVGHTVGANEGGAYVHIPADQMAEFRTHLAVDHPTEGDI